MGSGAPIVLTAPPAAPPWPWVLLRRGWACCPPPELSYTGLPTTAVLGRVRMRGVLAFAKEASEGRGQPPRVPVLRASQAPPAPPGGQARTWEEAEALRTLVLTSTWLAGEEGLIGLHSLGSAGWSQREGKRAGQPPAPHFVPGGRDSACCACTSTGTSVPRATRWSRCPSRPAQLRAGAGAAGAERGVARLGTEMKPAGPPGASHLSAQGGCLFQGPETHTRFPTLHVRPGQRWTQTRPSRRCLPCRARRRGARRWASPPARPFGATCSCFLFDLTLIQASFLIPHSSFFFYRGKIHMT